MSTDPRSLLFGLEDLHCIGAAPTEGADFSSSLSELIAAFHAAQVNSRARGDAGEWTDDKIERKLRWLAMGVSSHLIVPTLLTACMELDESSRVEAADYESDGDGGFVPCLRQDAINLRPVDAALESKLQALLSHHGSIVMKPSHGCNGECRASCLISPS